MRTAFFMPFLGTFLTGCRVVTGFSNFLYTGVETSTTHLFHTPRIYTL